MVGFCIILFKGCYVRNSPAENNILITLYLHEQNKTIKLKLEEYIIGTVAAEMPASFELEALKAQAVSARTYALKRILGNVKYPLGADLSDDINSCQAYISPEDFKQKHGNKSDEYLNKITRAVVETKGETMVCDGQPIDALYHSTCGGQTESAAEVWQKDVPYLTTVNCKYCSQSKHFSTVQVFSVSELNGLTGDGNCNQIKIKVLEKTTSGRIKKLSVNNNLLTGEKFRNLLNLPSNWWQYEIINNQLVINSRGYGHGVGMCQFGADGMAKEGKKYRDILRHYYTNIEFYKIGY